MKSEMYTLHKNNNTFWFNWWVKWTSITIRLRPFFVGLSLYEQRLHMHVIIWSTVQLYIRFIILKFCRSNNYAISYMFFTNINTTNSICVKEISFTTSISYRHAFLHSNFKWLLHIYYRSEPCRLNLITFLIPAIRVTVGLTRQDKHRKQTIHAGNSTVLLDVTG